MCLWGAASVQIAASSGNADPAPVRLAISETSVVGVNSGDAQAAMKVWARRIAEKSNLNIELNSKVFSSTAEILDMIRHQIVDAVVINTEEYRQASVYLDTREVVVKADPAEHQHVLVAKAGGRIRSIDDLRDASLILTASDSAFMAWAWLGTVLAGKRLPRAEAFFRSVTRASKPTQAILPVFFGQAAAGITTKRNFLMMCELNPQLSEQLTPLLTSPELVHSIHVFLKSYAGPFRKQLLALLSSLPDTAAGRQVMTLFKTQGLAMRSGDCLQAAVVTLETYERLHKGGAPRGAFN